MLEDEEYAALVDEALVSIDTEVDPRWRHSARSYLLLMAGGLGTLDGPQARGREPDGADEEGRP